MNVNSHTYRKNAGFDLQKDLTPLSQVSLISSARPWPKPTGFLPTVSIPLGPLEWNREEIPLSV